LISEPRQMGIIGVLYTDWANGTSHVNITVLPRISDAAS
jgi:hypothetical protein